MAVRTFVTDVEIIDAKCINFLRNITYRIKEPCLYLVKLSKLVWCSIPSSYSVSAVKGTSIEDLDDDVLVKEYRKHRTLLIGKVSNKPPVLINNEYSYIFLEQTVLKQCENGLSIRCDIPRKSIEHMFQLQNETSKNTYLENAVHQMIKGQESESKCQTTYITEKNTTGKRNTRNNVKRIPAKKEEPKSYQLATQQKWTSPRQPHSTTVSVTSMEKHYPNDTDLVVKPAPGSTYNSPLSRNTHCSIPETDTDRSLPSEFAPSGVSQYKSIVNNNALGISTSFRNSSNQTRNQGQNHTSSPNDGNVPSLKPPRHPDYANRNARLVSYGSQCWTMTGKPDQTTLSNWGFFATGLKDLVRCFQCGIGLKDWTADDDVMTEHVKHSPDCPFLLKELGPQKLNQLKNAILYPDLNLDQAEDAASDKTASTAASVRLPYPIRNPRYQTMESRVASFKEFPARVTQTPQLLAIAGFFFTGNGDVCRCFTCDGGLQHWAPEDDPMVEHAKYFPTCNYIQQIKGDEFVGQVQATMNGQESEGATGGSTSSTKQHADKAAHMGRLGLKDGSAGANKNDTSTDPVCTPAAQAGANKNVRSTDPLRTPAAQAVLDMGYPKHVVQKAIEALKKQGTINCTADEISIEILDNESKWSEASPNENAAQNNTGQSMLLAENERLKNLMRCMLCLTGETDILCLPCTHHRMCHECAKEVTNCPACGHRIQEKIRTYMA